MATWWNRTEYNKAVADSGQFKVRQPARSLPFTSGPMKAFKPIASSLMVPKHNDTIKFYERYDDYYEFTNFYHHPVRIDGHMWPTTEHYFQAQKFVGTPYYDYIRKLPFPRDAFRVSRDPVASRWIRGDWSAVKNDVMLKALRVKFEDFKLRSKLLGTGDKKLVEHTSNDSYWGDGGDGKGMNKLGELLMKVRDEIKVSESQKRTEKGWDIISGASTGLRRSSSLTSLRDIPHQSYHSNTSNAKKSEDLHYYKTGKFGTPTLHRKKTFTAHSSSSKYSYSPRPRWL